MNVNGRRRPNCSISPRHTPFGTLFASELSIGGEQAISVPAVSNAHHASNALRQLRVIPSSPWWVRAMSMSFTATDLAAAPGRYARVIAAFGHLNRYPSFKLSVSCHYLASLLGMCCCTGPVAMFTLQVTNGDHIFNDITKRINPTCPVRAFKRTSS